jgi:hypothetical protein
VIVSILRGALPVKRALFCCVIYGVPLYTKCSGYSIIFD